MVDRSEAIETVLESLRKGTTEYAAAENAGVSFVTWWRWRQEMPGLTERAADAKRARIPLIEDALYKAALKGSVTACLTILEKEDPEWRQRAKDLRPQQNVLILNGAAGNIVAMMNPEAKQKFLGALHIAGLIPEQVIDVTPSQNGHSNGNGNGAH